MYTQLFILIHIIYVFITYVKPSKNLSKSIIKIAVLNWCPTVKEFYENQNTFL